MGSQLADSPEVSAVEVSASRLFLWRNLPESTLAYLFTITLYSIASPLLSVFTTSFLVQQRNSPTEAMVFIGCQMGAIPVGFLLAGALLRHYSVGCLYAVGSFLVGCSTVGVACISTYAPTTFLAHMGIALAGLLQGAIAGIYWSTRLMLAIELTNAKNRDVFFALESASVVAMSVIVPLTLGALIEYQFFVPGLFTRNTSFGVLLALVVALLSIGAKVILKNNFTVPIPTTLRLTSENSPKWRAARALLFSKGIIDGYIAILPITLTLTYIGNEFALGLVQSICGLLCTVLVYALGSLIGTRVKRITVTKLAATVVTLAGVPLAIDASALSVALFIAGSSIAMSLFWNTTTPPVLSAIEACRTSEGETFAYTVDRELWLNFGRAVTILIMVSAYFYLGGAETLAIIPIVFSPAQLLLVAAAQRLDESEE